MTGLQGQVAIVTGAASGIGAAIVRRFVAAGARVVMADVQDDRGRRLADEIGPACLYQHADVSREDDMAALVDQALRAFGQLDGLVNNAGIAGPGGPIEQLQPQAFDAVMAVLARSAFLGMHFAAPPMKARGRGSIITIASVAGFRAGYGSHLYSAAKAAVMQLTRTVAMELGEAGVRVNCICPGVIATPLFGKAAGLGPEEADATVLPLRQMLSKAQPIGRAGEPDDVAEAALWLASDAAAFVNGHALVVDGGLTGGRPWAATVETRQRMREAFSRAAAEAPAG